MTELFLTFHVPGTPRPKQSFRYSAGGSYIPARVKAWQEQVGWAAKEEMMRKTPVDFPVCVELLFALPKDGRKRDPDNLSKAVLDAMKNIVYADDNQVMRLIVEKRYVDHKNQCGCHVLVRSINEKQME